MLDKRKPRQERATHADTKDSLNLLRKYFRTKKANNKGVMTDDEEDWLTDLFYDSILSHGSFRFLIKYPDGTGVLDFRNLGNFFEEYMNACADARETGAHNLEYIYFFDPTTNRKIKVEHQQIWREMLKEVNKVKPHILEEGIHMSPEKEIREKPSAFEFSSEQKKKEKTKE